MGPSPKTRRAGRESKQSKRIPQLVPTAVWLPHGKLDSPPPDHSRSYQGSLRPVCRSGSCGRADPLSAHGISGKNQWRHQGAAFPFLGGYRSGIVPLKLADDVLLSERQTAAGARGVGYYSAERTRWNGKTPFKFTR